MKKFLAVFLGSPNSPRQAAWDALDESTRQTKLQAGMEAWGQWMVTHHDSIVYTGGPLGPTLAVNEKGVTPTRNALAAFIVVKANSHEAAARLFENHPHFTIFPGDGVEIVECLPIPGGCE